MFENSQLAIASGRRLQLLFVPPVTCLFDIMAIASSPPHSAGSPMLASHASIAMSFIW